MPKLTRQSKAQQRIVRTIQRFVKQYGYRSKLGIHLHTCGLHDEYHRALAICGTGVVVAAGGGGVVTHWTDYSAQQLRQLLDGAKRAQRLHLQLV